jgi:quercetin 2,3-dioxygenase
MGWMASARALVGTLERMAVDVRRAGDRFHTKIDWLDSWHSFSFSNHYDPENTHHGLLLVNNDDRIAGGGGFPTHPHSDMEIVTWVLSGELEHRDSTGTNGVIYPGLAQRMSAGRGIRHSEVNASATEEVHLVQMWVLPDTRGIEPGYEQRDLGDAFSGGGLVPVASGRNHDGAIALHQHEAVLWVGRLRANEEVKVPDAPHAHVFMALGAASLEGTGELATGDAARPTEAGALGLTATADGTEVVIWETA